MNSENTNSNIRPIDANALLVLAHNHVDGTVDCNDIARFPTLDYVPRQQWISVKDRLPEDDVMVLVSANSKSDEPVVAITHYTHRKYGYNIEGWIEPWQYFFYDYEITHWMPLPEPQKEEA